MRKLHLLLATAAVFTISSCGGGGGSTTTPTPVTTQPKPPAHIEISQDGTAQVCASPIKKFRLGLPVRFVESGGQGYFVNFAEVQLFKKGVKIEAMQLGAADFTAGGGTNHFAARSTTRVVVFFDFNRIDFDSAQETFDFTDDSGNHSSVDLNGIDPIVATQSCAFAVPALNK